MRPAVRPRENPVPVSERPRLIFFHSDTSGRCRKVEAFLANVLQQGRNHDTFRLEFVDVDRHPQLAERFRISELPTLVVVEAEREKARIADPRSMADIKTMLAPWLRRAGQR